MGKTEKLLDELETFGSGPGHSQALAIIATVTREAREKAKRERFLAVAKRRTRVVLEKIRLVANCGNRSGYVYTPEEVAAIFAAIDKELEVARRAFEPKRARSVSLFSFEA